MNVQDAVAYEQATKGRTQLAWKAPFWGSISLGMPLVEDPKCQTAWTNGVQQGYNPKYIRSLAVAFVIGLLAHEALHVVLMHHTRRGNRDHHLWNMAGDYVINLILIAAGFSLPEGFLYDLRFQGMSTDQVYDILLTEQGRQEGQPGKPKEDGQGDSQESDTGQKQEGQGEGQGQDQSSSSGDPGACGEVRDMPSPSGAPQPSEAEIAEAESKLTVNVAQAQQLHKTLAGSLPAGMARIVKEMLDPEIPWQEILWKFVQSNAKTDWSMKPNQQYLGEGLWLPSISGDAIEEIALFVDTSSSQSQRDLDKCAGAIETLMDQYPTNLLVLHIDTEVQKVQEFGPQDRPIKLRLSGGGGTSFVPPFEWIEKHGRAPTVAIYLTDGECYRYPKNEPNYPVLWIGTRRPFKPPWGEVVMMRKK